MKKLISVLSIISTLFLLSPYFVKAQFESPEFIREPEPPTRIFRCLPTDTLRQCLLRILADVVRVLLVIVIALSAIFLIIAGIQYIWGSENARKAAKNKLIYATLGLVVAFLAWAIVLLLVRVISGGRV